MDETEKKVVYKLRWVKYITGLKRTWHHTINSIYDGHKDSFMMGIHILLEITFTPFAVATGHVRVNIGL